MSHRDPTEILETPLSEAVRNSSPEILAAAASDPSLTEDLALVLLQQMNLPTQVLDRLSHNGSVMKSRWCRENP